MMIDRSTKRPSLKILACFVASMLTGLSCSQATSKATENEPLGRWRLQDLSKPPKFAWQDDQSPIRSLTFENEPFRGKPTDVFAFYATPGTLSGDRSKDKALPAIVLIHGGGGTAFAEWVQLWAKRGYAAIAMDLSGRRPPAPRFDKEGQLIIERRKPRTRLPRGGPEADHTAKFTNIGGDPSDDWQQHAVAAVIRAHSLVRSFTEVDKDRTAVTGISWGGYLTCLVASVDNRFKAAVPVYGCGFLHEGESVQKRLVDQLPEEQREAWIRHYDPSAWLPKCEIPIFFVNGANDKHYPLDSYLRSYNLLKSPRQIRVEVGMGHSHGHGWAPKEIELFIAQHVNGGVALPKLDSPQVEGRTATVKISSKSPIQAARLHFTTDAGPLVNRHWKSAPAVLVDDEATVKIPDETTIWLLSVSDDRDAMVTTAPVFPKR